MDDLELDIALIASSIDVERKHKHHKAGWLTDTTIIWVGDQKIKTSLKNLLPKLGQTYGGNFFNSWVEVKFVDSDNVIKSGKIFHNDTGFSDRIHLRSVGVSI